MEKSLARIAAEAYYGIELKAWSDYHEKEWGVVVDAILPQKEEEGKFHFLIAHQSYSPGGTMLHIGRTKITLPHSSPSIQEVRKFEQQFDISYHDGSTTIVTGVFPLREE